MGDSKRPVGTMAVHVAGAALFGWLYGGDLALWVRAQSAPVSALTEAPGLALPIVGLLVAIAGVGLLAAGLVRHRDSSWKGFRLFPIAVVVLLFIDFGVLSSVRVAMPSLDRALVAVRIFTDFAISGITEAKVPADAKALEAVLPRLGPAPWLIKGQPASWRVDVRACEGPAGDGAGQPAGTLIYCVAADRSKAWVTVVGLPVDQRFGEAQVVSTDAAWVGVVAPPTTSPLAPDGEDEAPEDEDILPTPPNDNDSGR